MRKLLKKFLPMPAESLNFKLNSLEEHIAKNNTEVLSYLETCFSDLDELLEENKVLRGRFDSLDNLVKSNLEIAKTLTENNKVQSSYLDEILWSQIYNNTIEGSSWLKNMPVWPGRAAVGYAFLFVMYRILNDIKPKNILDLGLGITTKMISEYTKSFPCSHIAIEHDVNWIEFFKKDYKLSESTEIIKLDIKSKSFRDDDKVISYENFEAALDGKKFDFISIDGPFGYLANKYSRVDIVSLLPDCLMDSFVILIDDYNRPGEKKLFE